MEKISVPHIILEDYDGIRLSQPSRLFYDPFRREIYVVDAGNNRILIYAHDFFPLMSLDVNEGIKFPIGMALDSKGNFFVTQAPTKKYPNGRLSVLNASLRWERDLRFEGFKGANTFIPRNIACNKHDFLYVTGKEYPGVVVLDKDGKFSHLFLPVDLFEGQSTKASICDIEIDDAGKIYLLSEEIGRIYVYDTQEKFLLQFGQKGGSTGKLSRPRGLAVDRLNNRIYVVDYMRHTVSVYSLEGKFLFEFGGLGWSKGWLQFPGDICVDRAGNVLVADTFNNRVQVFRIVSLE
jgi:DNA-binding beta-propeller fold protein YncE